MNPGITNSTHNTAQLPTFAKAAAGACPTHALTPLFKRCNAVAVVRFLHWVEMPLGEFETQCDKKNLFDASRKIDAAANAEIEEAEKKGGVIAHFSTRLQSYKQYSKIDSKSIMLIFLAYARILNKYDVTNGGKLLFKKDNGLFNDLNYRDCIDVLITTLFEHLKNPKEMDEEGITFHHQVGEDDILARYIPNKGKLKIFKYTLDPINFGGYGSIHPAFDFNTAKFKVLKIARIDSTKEEQVNKAYEMMKCEINNLLRIQTFKLYKVQKAPTVTFDIKMFNGARLIGYDAIQYTKSLAHFRRTHNLNLHTKLYYCKEMVKIIESLQFNKIRHGDFKDSNILIDESGIGVLIDWSSAQFLSETIKCFGIPETPHSLHYYDRKALVEAGNANDYPTGLKLALAMDRFALGTNLYTLLFNEHPYIVKFFADIHFSACDPTAKLDLEKMYSSLGNSPKTRPIVDFIASMIEHDFKKRPDMEMISKFWGAINLDDFIDSKAATSSIATSK